MCDTCGCGSEEKTVIINLSDDKEIIKPKNEHQHHDQHEHTHEHNRIVEIEQEIMQKSNLIAERNRGYFEAKSIFAYNLVSSPGSGKTSLLEKTISNLKDRIDFYVIEGDQQTTNDAERIKATGVPVIQINTGNGCHLDSEMISKSIKELNIKNNAVLMIENVGNLVCPSLFDLGENKRVVIISTTEGDDKPLKYPSMFSTSEICIINKIDLLPYLNCDIEKIKEYALQVNPKLLFFELSAITGEGIGNWYDFVLQNSIKIE